MAHNFNLMN